MTSDRHTHGHSGHRDPSPDDTKLKRFSIWKVNKDDHLPKQQTDVSYSLPRISTSRGVYLTVELEDRKYHFKDIVEYNKSFRKRMGTET